MGSFIPLTLNKTPKTMVFAKPCAFDVLSMLAVEGVQSSWPIHFFLPFHNPSFFLQEIVFLFLWVSLFAGLSHVAMATTHSYPIFCASLSLSKRLMQVTFFLISTPLFVHNI